MAKTKKTRIEWVGGVAVMPGYVTGEGEPYRPEALLWLDDNQLVLGVTTEKPGQRGSGSRRRSSPRSFAQGTRLSKSSALSHRKWTR